MNRNTLFAILLIVAVIFLGGWHSVRNSFGREAVREITRQLFRHN